jgi:hypothetical protein
MVMKKLADDNPAVRRRMKWGLFFGIVD